MTLVFRGLAGLLVGVTVLLVANGMMRWRVMSLLQLVPVIPLTVYALGGQRLLSRLLPMLRDRGDR